jgi:hypothetical protein
MHQTTLSNPQLFSKSETPTNLKVNYLYKLLQKKSIDFLYSNAERAFKNLTQFSFSDLEIVSKSGQTVCAKLADKMRKKILDEELPDVKILIKGDLKPELESVSNLTSKELLSKYLMNVMKNNKEQQGVPFKRGQGYIKPEDINFLQVKEESSLKFGIQKELLKVLFPEGYDLKDIELNGDMLEFEEKKSISSISEQSEDKENYISGNLQVKGKGV